MKDFEKPVFYVKDLKKSFSPSVVDWKKKQIKGRIDGEVKMFRFDEVEFLYYNEENSLDMMKNKQKLNELYKLAELLRNEYCEKFALQNNNGSCYCNDESNKVDFCPFSLGWECIVNDFLDLLYMIINLLNEEEKAN